MPSSGVDSNIEAHPILVDADGRPYVLLSDGTTTGHVDPETGGVTISRAEHRRVAQSNLWISSYIKTALAAGSGFYIHLMVGADKNAHIDFVVQSEAKIAYYLYENPTVTGNGTALSEVCINRQTVVASTMNVLYNPTASADGTLLETGIIGTAGKFTAAGGHAALGGYWLLKKSESYFVKVINNDAAAKDVAIQVIWHEE